MLVASIHYGGFSASEQTISEYISSNINFLLTVRIYTPFSSFQQISQAVGTLLGLLIGSEAFLPLGENR